MQTTPEQLRKLSRRFYGNKAVDRIVFEELKLYYQDRHRLKAILQKTYRQIYDLYFGFDPSLIEVFAQFFYNQMHFCSLKGYPFEKATCLLELSVHHFNLSWEKRWAKDRSFEEFRSILVRHSLYRPPHSVFVFSLQDLKDISAHYIETFFRFYRSYFFTFTPWVDIVVTTYQKHQIRKDVKDMELEKLREEADLYNEKIDPELEQQLMAGNSIHQIPEKKRREMMEQQQQRERQERIDRVLKKRLEQLQTAFDEKIQQQDEHFLKVAEELKNPTKKK